LSHFAVAWYNPAVHVAVLEDESGGCARFCFVWSGAPGASLRQGKVLYMKAGIHPNYVDAEIVCACGMVYKTRSIKPEIRVEICGACHPFFTGKQKIVDTEGRVEKFLQRYGMKKEEEAGAQSGS
jgi:large subunit ribosomal protein L31